MIDFTYIKFGILISMAAILFGAMLGLSFGCCEDDIKGILKSKAYSVLDEKYKGQKKKARRVADKSWTYLKRAHLHSQTMGVIAIAFSLLVAWLNSNPRLQIGISFLGGFGSLGYGVFWFCAAVLAPEMGGTHHAKEAVALLAQTSGGAFFVAGLALFGSLGYKFFFQQKSISNKNS